MRIVLLYTRSMWVPFINVLIIRLVTNTKVILTIDDHFICWINFFDWKGLDNRIVYFRRYKILLLSMTIWRIQVLRINELVTIRLLGVYSWKFVSLILNFFIAMLTITLYRVICNRDLGWIIIIVFFSKAVRLNINTFLIIFYKIWEIIKILNFTFLSEILSDSISLNKMLTIDFFLNLNLFFLIMICRWFLFNIL